MERRPATAGMQPERPGKAVSLNGKREQFVQFAGAIREGIQSHADFIQEGKVQVREWSWFCVTNMAVAFHATSRAARDDARQIGVIVNIGIADATAVEQERIVQ